MNKTQNHFEIKLIKQYFQKKFDLRLTIVSIIRGIFQIKLCYFSQTQWVRNLQWARDAKEPITG